jgi:hypothetical protein
VTNLASIFDFPLHFNILRNRRRLYVGTDTFYQIAFSAVLQVTRPADARTMVVPTIRLAAVLTDLFLGHVDIRFDFMLPGGNTLQWMDASLVT